MKAEDVRTAILKYWSLILSATVAAAIVAGIVAWLLPAKYQSTVTMQATISPSTNSTYALLVLDRLVGTEATLATSRPVLAAVAAQYRGVTADQLSRDVVARVEQNSMLFHITVTDTNPGRASGIANRIATTLIANQQTLEAKRRELAEKPLRDEMATVQQSISATQQALRAPGLTADQIAQSKATLDQLQTRFDALSQSLQDTQQAEALNTVSLSISDPAQPSEFASAPNFLANMAVAAPGGLLLGLLLVLARGYLDLRVRDAESVTRVTGWPVLATVFRSPGATSGLGSQAAFDVAAARWPEDLDRSMAFLGVITPLRSVAFAGASDFDSASALTEQYARYTAGNGVRTLLVDANLRRATQATRYSENDQPSVSDALLEIQGGANAAALVRGYAQRGAVSELPTLSVLAAGAPVPNPQELIASHAMRSLYQGLVASDAQAILLDIAPLAEWNGAEPLAASVDGLILVLQRGRATKPGLERLRARLDRSGATILGCVLVDGRRFTDATGRAIPDFEQRSPPPQIAAPERANPASGGEWAGARTPDAHRQTNPANREPHRLR
jgi:capsular polysaccharide biosynthesis protein